MNCLQNMPEDFLLRNVNGQDVWVSEGETDSVEIKAQSHVRIKIANVQLQPEKLVRLAQDVDLDVSFFQNVGHARSV